MGRDIIFVRPFSEKEEDDCVAQLSLGSGDAWPCYVRPFMIAGYRKYSKDGDPKWKERVLASILKCCPPDPAETNNTNTSCGFFGHYQKDFGTFKMSARHNMVDEAVLFRGETQILLEKAGLSPCVDWLLMHHRCDIGPSVLKRLSVMMLQLKDWVPYESDELDGTPYYNTDSDYNVADDRWIELIEAFEKAAKEEEVVAIIE